jgi:protein-S-isoprenylcysteine O-methyltransferase Ste14
MRASPVPPPLWTLIFGAAMWALNRYYPVFTLIPAPWNGLGWCVMVLAFIPPFAAITQFVRAGTTVDPLKPEAATALVTSGIYGWTRNPMYLGLSIVLLGWAIRLGTLSPFAGPLLFVPLIERAQILPEERALRVVFGKDYEQYCRRVHRWLGRNRPS